MPRKKSSTDETPKKRGRISWKTCSTSLIAHMAGISERAVRDWVKKGTVKRTGRGKYDIKSAFQAALKRDVFQGGTSLSEVTTEEIQQNKALLEKARADMAETEVAIEKRKLIDSEDIKGFMANQMVLFRKDLMALSRVIPGSCYGMTEKEIEDHLATRISAFCEERFDNTELSSFIKFLNDSK